MLLLPTILAFGFAFLYVPILSMVVYSFNASRLVTVWDAAHSPTLKWYGRAAAEQPRSWMPRWLSLKIAIMNATGAVILGTMAGFALARFGRFRGRSPARGTDHGAAGAAGDHHRPVAAAAVRGHGAGDRLAAPAAASPPSPSRTSAFRCRMSRSSCRRGSIGFDDSLEEAALDLGARPATVFCASHCR
jgi:putrescine transport system permease protein